jgi:fatty-acyl-CoA synthase
MSFHSLVDLLQKRASGPSGNTIRYFFYKKGSLEISLSFQQLYGLSSQYAEKIRREISADSAFISISNDAQFAVAFFALLLAGKKPIPVASPDGLEAEVLLSQLSNFSRVANSKALLCHTHQVSFFKDLNFQILTLPDTPSLRKELTADLLPKPLSVSPQAEDIAFIQFSSGSTSAPKGVLLSHRALLTNLEQIHCGLSVGDEILLSWLPFYHDMGLIGGLLGCLYSNVEGHFWTPIDFIKHTTVWMRLVSEIKATVLMGPDFMFRTLAQCSRRDANIYDWSSVRACLTGSEPVRYASCEQFLQSFAKHQLSPNVMMPVYGLAEASLAVTFSRPGLPLKKILADSVSLAEGFLKISSTMGEELVSCGSPLKNVEIQILNEQGETLGELQVGEIAVRTPSLASGFLSEEQRMSTSLREGFYLSGDLGILYQGDLYIVGRKKDLLIFHGKKYQSVDLENRLFQKHSKEIARVAVVSVPQGGQEKMAVAIEARNFVQLQRQKLKDSLIETLAPLPLSPEDIYILPRYSLPRTSSGKLRRFKIKEMIAEGVWQQGFLNSVRMYRNSLVKVFHFARSASS